MPKFMLLLTGVDIDSHRGNCEPSGIIDKYAQWANGLRAANRFVEAQKLKDGEGFRVKKIKGHVVDGPFAETKEMISSFFVIEAKDYPEAISIARECPAVMDQGGYVEVREVTTCPGAE